MADGEETEITGADIKDPKKLVKKARNIALTAVGGVAQRIIDRMINSADKDAKLHPGVRSLLETLAFAVAAGTVKNELADRFFAGAVAGASADTLERGLLAAGIDINNLSLENLKAAKNGNGTTVPSGTAATNGRNGITAPVESAENIDF